MCGIAGLVHLDNARPASLETVVAMTRTLAHRGPDGEGFWVKGPVALGHRRLAIIDLSTGDQPMFSHDGKYGVVFNGEIYNYLEVRQTLLGLGHQFVTQSDTEVILEAYRAWGTGCLAHFNGMFAFALWDTAERSLFCARDRLGEKPLFWAEQGGTFYFGSEAKALFAAGLAKEPDLSLLDIFLACTYIPAPYCFFKGIQKLQPGHFLLVKNGQVKSGPYWHLPHPLLQDQRRDEPRILEEFQALFTDAVRLRLRSDVPLGAFLSGGLDSASVVAEMAGLLERPVQTFTIGFEQHAYDERDLARLVADKFHTQHIERVVAPNDAEAALDAVIRAYDEPFGDSSALPTRIVSQIAREKVTVALTGDGGDEVLSGYTIHQGERVSHWWGRLPGPLTRRAPAVWSKAQTFGLSSVSRIARVLALAGSPFVERLEAKQSGVDPAVRRALLAGQKYWPVGELMRDILAPVAHQDTFGQLNYWLLKVSLPDDMLTKVDRAAMATALETRVPFLDHRLVELMAHVHMDIKLKGLTRKHILRATAGKKLPPSLLRQKKRGFGVPLEHWLQGQGKALLGPRAQRVAQAGWVRGEVLAAQNPSERGASVLWWCLAMLAGAM